MVIDYNKMFLLKQEKFIYHDVSLFNKVRGLDRLQLEFLNYYYLQ